MQLNGAVAPYADLYAAIGVNFGGNTTSQAFNLPDLRGRVMVGAGQGVGLTARSVGAAFGEEQHQLTIAEMPSHVHDLLRTGGVGPTSLAIQTPSGGYGGVISAADLLKMQAAGGDQAHNNMQPSLVLNYIIKL
jgi:microcystin-dependent protein